jgi:hypothetical protein
MAWIHPAWNVQSIGPAGTDAKSAKHRSRIMTKQPHTPQTDRPPAPSPNVRLSPPPPALMRLFNPWSAACSRPATWAAASTR